MPRSALGGIDILVNNASGFGSSDDEAGWAVSVAVDMMAIVHATQAALPFLKEAKGSVVNTSSISAMRTAARQPPYGAIKAAVIHYTATQAAMYAKDGIRVNGVAPGSIEFPGGVWDRRKSDNPEPLQRDPAVHPVRPAGPSRGGGERRAVPRLAAGVLDHRPDHRRGRRAAAMTSAAAPRRSRTGT